MITYVHIIHVYTETNRPPSVNEEQPDLINLEADDNSEEKIKYVHTSIHNYTQLVHDRLHGVID